MPFFPKLTFGSRLALELVPRLALSLVSIFTLKLKMRSPVGVDDVPAVVLNVGNSRDGHRRNELPRCGTKWDGCSSGIFLATDS